VRCFLAELYMPTARAAAGELNRVRDRARVAADELSRNGTPIRYFHSIYVPIDEICFLLYEAESSATVEAALAQAELAHDRLLETLTDQAPERVAVRGV
jgi:hypothetical protein